MSSRLRAVALDTFIFFVASRRRTCFYWAELDARPDLTFVEVERIFETMPRFREIWLSGGEPTLREDRATRLHSHVIAFAPVGRPDGPGSGVP